MLVYSTNPNYKAPENEEQNQEELTNDKQNLIVALDRRKRAGKQVTIVRGFVGPELALAQLGRELRNRCGTGGSVKDGEIIIQGDMRDKVVGHLESLGYKAKRGN